MFVFLELWYNSEYRFIIIVVCRFIFYEMLDLKYILQIINVLLFFVYVGYFKISIMNFYII